MMDVFVYIFCHPANPEEDLGGNPFGTKVKTQQKQQQR